MSDRTGLILVQVTPQGCYHGNAASRGCGAAAVDGAQTVFLIRSCTVRMSTCVLLVSHCPFLRCPGRLSVQSGGRVRSTITAAPRRCWEAAVVGPIPPPTPLGETSTFVQSDAAASSSLINGYTVTGGQRLAQKVVSDLKGSSGGVLICLAYAALPLLLLTSLWGFTSCVSVADVALPLALERLC